MNRHGDRRALFASLAALFLIISLAASAAFGQRRGGLSGVVTDGFSQGVSGATVRLYSLNRIVEVKSDKDGHFQITNLPADVYELEITAAGFKTKSIQELKVTPDNELNCDVALHAYFGCAPPDSVSYESVVFDAANVRGVVVLLMGRDGL
jgi:Carboxypeptidase regulatory-like domain